MMLGRASSSHFGLGKHTGKTCVSKSIFLLASNARNNAVPLYPQRCALVHMPPYIKSISIPSEVPLLCDVLELLVLNFNPEYL